MTDATQLLPLDAVTHRIFMLREQEVLLDSDLAALYGVATRRLNEQVRRNRERFPRDFIFKLTAEEFANLKSHTATSSWGGRRKLPLAMQHDSFIHNTRAQLKQVFDALRKPMTPPDPPDPLKRPIGFVTLEHKGKKTAGRRA